MGNTDYEEGSEVLETTEEATEEKKTEEEQEESQGERLDKAEKWEKKTKKEKPKKNRRGLRALLLLLQHAALAVMVFAVFVVTVCSTVRISGVHSNGAYVNYTGYSDPGKAYEESELFNTIFGHVAADIIRFGVVSSQLETDGAFDGDKVVDVTAYNYRSGGLPEQYVTADYRLGDLLKWDSFGFEYSGREMTGEEAVLFLAEATRMRKVDTKKDNQDISDAEGLKSNAKTYIAVNDASADKKINVEYEEWDEESGFVEDYQPIGELAQHAGTEEIVLETVMPADAEYLDDLDGTQVHDYEVLVNRYQTVDGKNLEEYVSSWKQYYELCDNVERAAESLSYNYQEYLEYLDYYSVSNSNVRYLIEKKVGKETQYYSNMAAGSSYRNRVLEMMADLKSRGKEAKLPVEKFIYYCPGDMTYVTNTAIAEDTVRQILQGYEYAYPETVKIWIGVDTAYPAKDVFTRAADYLPNLWIWAAAGLLAGILYLVLFIYQTVVTGRVYDAAGQKRTQLNAFDRIPTEAAVCIALGVGLLVVWIVVVVTELAGIDPFDLGDLRDVVHEQWFKALLLGGAFAADIIFTFFFYSLVRRLKARTFWKNSFLCRLVKRLISFAWKVYDNGSIVVRTWVPYCVILGFNILVLLLASSWGDADMLLLLFLAIIDVIVGILIYKHAKERQDIVEGIEIIAGGQVEYKIDTENLHGDNRNLAASVNSIGKGIQEAVEISMKDERMKADLITNVSHDIKTPLTSIINYVDLLKREQVESEKARDYIRVLDEKSQRLKQLTDDLVEASKITSGNISLHFERINLTELMNQTLGEFSEKFDEKGLVTVMNVNTRNVVIDADSRRIWRVMENLFNNVYKYAMPGTRVYVTMEQKKDEETICVIIKNISENYLNCKPEELTERFIRGDESRTTEGSGLGLSIAKNLTIAQKGSFEIELDGDLFKVILTFPLAAE